MLYYIIELSEGIDVNKTSESNECNICHYWYFLDEGFKFQPNVCNRCHDLLIMSVTLSDVLSHIKWVKKFYLLVILKLKK